MPTSQKKGPLSLCIIERQAVLLSILYHFIIIHYFTFTFPIHSVLYKPPLVFLGQILEKHDLEDIQHTATGQQQIDGSRPIAIPIVSPDSSFYFQEETAIQKPAFSNAIKKGNRDIIHPVLWDTADKQPLKSPTPLIPGIDLTIPSYKPLGLHSK